MKRKIYLEGDIADKFGKELNADVSSVKDAMLLINANYPEFKKYLIDSHEAGVGFAIDVAGIHVEEEEDIILPLMEGDITIMSIPAGSKSGGMKILAAIAIITFIFFAPVLAPAAGATSSAGTSLSAAMATMATTGTMTVAGVLGTAGMMLGMSLAMAGIQQLMAPDPSVDEQGPQSYLFNGSEQNIIEGDPVPVLYGELRVPGRPISFAVANSGSTFSNNTSSDQDQSSGSATFTFSGGWQTNTYPVIA
jgi:predicted phage tail protein